MSLGELLTRRSASSMKTEIRNQLESKKQMKSKISTPHIEPIEYPCLMQGKATGTVYYMLKANEGIQLFDSTNSTDRRGIVLLDPDRLEPFFGELTLSNS